MQRHACDERQVGMRNVTRAAEGTYECQVSGEGPLFATVSQQKELRVAGEFECLGSGMCTRCPICSETWVWFTLIWVYFDLGCSTIYPILLGQMGIWQNWLVG